MAATIGPDVMVGTSILDGYGGETARCFDRSTDANMSSPDSSLASPQTSPNSALPPPNPPFVFPSRPSSSSAPSSFSRATGRRPRSAVDSQEPGLVIATDSEKPKLRSPALPVFSFNPGAALPSPRAVETTFLVPPKSPSAPESPRSIPIRPAGHRRGGSEFVGGNIRAGDAVTVLSSSPTKSESGMASPLLQPAKPNRPRGHAHRRSAAISSHDLASIILPSPNQNLRGSSAPASPAMLPDREVFPVQEAAPPVPDPVPSPIPEMAGKRINKGTPPLAAEFEPPVRPQARNRVGFSDTLEFIPRPLSLVSNETSSTVTARPGHSVSGSISSVISVTNPDRELHSPVGFGSARKLNESRPSTAGAILERTQTEEQEQPLPSPRRRGSIPFLGAIPPAGLTAAMAPATPSPTKSTKKWSFFGLDPFVAASPTRSRPVSVSSAESQKETAAAVSTRPANEVSDSPDKQPVDEEGGQKPSCKKRTKKQKKVKTWAGSILSRKPKTRHGKQKRRAPTPPPLLLSGTRVDGDNDESSTGMSPEPEPSVPSFLVTDSTSDDVEDSWGSSSLPDEDTSYPMIDLDAALGPFNTPLPRNPEWEAAQRAGGLIKKQLHSAAGMSRFTGPGMHYHHRRAESAPEMAPFDVGRLGFPRFGSSSTMADVFEEDEEDDHGSATKSTGQSTPVGEPTPSEKGLVAASDQENASLPDIISLKLSAIVNSASPAEALEPKGAVGPVDNDKPLGSPSTKFNHSSTSLHEDVIPEEPTWNSSSIITRSSMDSATPSPRHVLRARELTPVDVSPLNLPLASLAPISPYSMTQSSAFPSPRSPMSYDAHRISTAPSSITEDNFQSLLMGEPGPEVRISVDDIPSLTSSNSTITRESIFAQHPQARQPGPLSDQPRPASFTSSAFGRRRSSLASLSRLISSSHGERSKLSMEVSMDNEPEKKSKVSKTKRLSRLVQFWKTKEGEAQ